MVTSWDNLHGLVCEENWYSLKPALERVIDTYEDMVENFNNNGKFLESDVRRFAAACDIMQSKLYTHKSDLNNWVEVKGMIKNDDV